MTNKIIEAARLAGATRAYPEAQSTRDDAYLVGRQFLERFYAIARAEALEDAAKACRPFGKTGAVVAAAIKALKHQAAAIAAGKGEG